MSQNTLSKINTEVYQEVTDQRGMPFGASMNPTFENWIESQDLVETVKIIDHYDGDNEETIDLSELEGGSRSDFNYTLESRDGDPDTGEWEVELYFFFSRVMRLRRFFLEIQIDSINNAGQFNEYSPGEFAVGGGFEFGFAPIYLSIFSGQENQMRTFNTDGLTFNNRFKQFSALTNSDTYDFTEELQSGTSSRLNIEGDRFRLTTYGTSTLSLVCGAALRVESYAQGQSISLVKMPLLFASSYEDEE